MTQIVQTTVALCANFVNSRETTPKRHHSVHIYCVWRRVPPRRIHLQRILHLLSTQQRQKHPDERGGSEKWAYSPIQRTQTLQVHQHPHTTSRRVLCCGSVTSEGGVCGGFQWQTQCSLCVRRVLPPRPATSSSRSVAHASTCRTRVPFLRASHTPNPVDLSGIQAPHRRVHAMYGSRHYSTPHTPGTSPRRHFEPDEIRRARKSADVMRLYFPATVCCRGSLY